MRKQLEILIIKANPIPGGEITKCKMEAISLAKAYNCKVEFTHNGLEFLVDEEGNCVKLN